MKQRHTILVDICWTLFYSNTTFDFLDYLLTNKSYHFIKVLFRLPLIKELNILIYKLTGKDIFRNICVKYLRGYTHKELMHKAESFYNDYLEPRKIEEVWQLLNEDKEIVLVSGTLDIIAETVAQHLHATTYYASQLIYNAEEICTGKYQDFLLNKSTIRESYRHFDIITDNLTDYPLVLQAGHTTIVEYNNQKRWQKRTHNLTNITYIHADRQRY